MLALPARTRAADVQVAVGGGRLEISLRWYGRVVEGALRRPVKAADTHWCLEGDEVGKGQGRRLWVGLVAALGLQARAGPVSNCFKGT